MIWLIGNRGMLGTELSLVLEKQGLACMGTDREIDITQPNALTFFAERQAVTGVPINWIINCAAYTAVDKAEDDGENCYRLNTEGAGNIAVCAKRIGARMIHLSTDYVFNGCGVKDTSGAIRPYREDDETDPIGVYGRTKRDGERAVQENTSDVYIIRTAWLYGKYGNNFVHTMLRLMKERDTVTVVDDQRGSPTWAFDLAHTITAFIIASEAGKTIPFGIYHFSNEGNMSWFDFAREIYDEGRNLGLLTDGCTVKPCTSAEFPARVKRPAYSVLDKSKIKDTLGITIPFWKESLSIYLHTLVKGAI
ncbi:MAG: dTDP-4-dehydrorhamnose reductase [Treponema sp.]|jgi:dTDP-4-dehydrorhamnose reductase|nr:dTDP-4-dehydrorhamnose reductase [Treponema sp.]